MNIKQLFCRHIYKLVKTEPNGMIIRWLCNIPVKAERYFINHYQCVKCGRLDIDTSFITVALTPEERDDILNMVRKGEIC